MSDVKPTSPWKPSAKDKLRELITFVGSMLASFTLVAVTELKGKLA